MPSEVDFVEPAPEVPQATAITPFDAGWAPTAMAIRAVQRSATPLVLRLEIAGAGEVVLDFARRAYGGGLTAERFPVAPAAVRVVTQPTFPGAPPLFALPGAELDGLLWHIGYHAFPAGRAPWLPDGARYRLSRWPNLSDLPITLDQVRMTAMLGNGAVSTEELGAMCGVTVAEARSVLNAFAVVGILRPVADAPSVPVPTPETRGLFARLRDRLGMR